MRGACVSMSTCVYACDKVCVYLSREIFISITFFRVQVIPPSAYVYVGMCIHPYTCRHACMCVYIYMMMYIVFNNPSGLSIVSSLPWQLNFPEFCYSV